MSLAAGWRAVAMLAFALGGCVGPGRMEGSVLVVPAKGYRIAVPAGWERIDTEADLALRHPTLSAALMVHGTCEGPTPGRPLGVLAQHLRFGLTDMRGLAEERVEVAGHAAVRSRFTARLDGEPVAVRAVTLTARRCAYDLAVVASPERIEPAAVEFERFVASFGLAEATP